MKLNRYTLILGGLIMLILGSVSKYGGNPHYISWEAVGLGLWWISVSIEKE